MSPSLLDFVAWSDYDFARSWMLGAGYSILDTG